MCIYLVACSTFHCRIRWKNVIFAAIHFQTLGSMTSLLGQRCVDKRKKKPQLHYCFMCILGLCLIHWISAMVKDATSQLFYLLSSFSRNGTRATAWPYFIHICTDGLSSVSGLSNRLVLIFSPIYSVTDFLRTFCDQFGSLWTKASYLRTATCQFIYFSNNILWIWGDFILDILMLWIYGRWL